MLRITDPKGSRVFYEALGMEFRRELPIVRDGQLEATNYFFGFPDQDEELELTFNHDGRSYGGRLAAASRSGRCAGGLARPPRAGASAHRARRGAAAREPSEGGARARHVVFKLRSHDPGNVSPPVHILCAFDKQTLHDCGKSVGATLKPGAHVLRAYAIDAQDNRSATTVVKFKIVKKR
jgi:catechol 2,3-dioxygenase-like lactoylglutathione lyase family enzyme